MPKTLATSIPHTTNRVVNVLRSLRLICLSLLEKNLQKNGAGPDPFIVLLREGARPGYRAQVRFAEAPAGSAGRCATRIAEAASARGEAPRCGDPRTHTRRSWARAQPDPREPAFATGPRSRARACGRTGHRRNRGRDRPAR